MHACHADASCHLGVARTLKNAGTLLLVGRYGSLHQMIGTTLLQVSGTKDLSPNYSLAYTLHPLPNSPEISVSVDYFGFLPITAHGNSYILLFTDRFSRRADMFAVTAAEFTAEGTANILVNRFIPLWGYPSTILSDNGLQFCAQLATAVYKRLGVHKLTTSAYHPNGNGGVETCKPHHGANASHGLQRTPK